MQGQPAMLAADLYHLLAGAVHHFVHKIYGYFCIYSFSFIIHVVWAVYVQFGMR